MRAQGASPVLRLFLFGRFRAELPDSTEVTPRGAKLQALLALLATSPDLFRNRRWIEDKLWSDRGPEQASASLRQALAEIRRALGPAQDVLVADRQKVGLARGGVEIEDGGDDGTAFLEGLDVRDPEFEHWLRNERLRRLSDAPLRAAPPPRPLPAAAPLGAGPPRGEGRPRAIVLLKSRTVADSLALIEDLCIDAIALSLREALRLPVLSRRQAAGGAGCIEITVQAIPGSDGTRTLRARAVDGTTDQLLWSGTSAGFGGFSGPEDTGIVQFANQVVEVIADALSMQPVATGLYEPQALHRLAVRKLWTMNAARLAEAEALLTLADELQPGGGLNAARRAQLRVLRMVEQNGRDARTLRDEADGLCRLAMEREPSNSMVLAVVSYVRASIDPTPAFAAEVAARSVRINAANPLAWDSLSYANLFAGRLDEAHRLALQVQQIGSTMPNRFWWDMGLCLTAALRGDGALALRMAESAAALAPEFRAAHRYVVALGAALGRPEAALAAASQLGRIEPGFTLDALAHDPEYPVGVLRRAGLLRSDRIAALGGETD